MYSDFIMWLERILKIGLPNDTIAVNFNLYEGVDNHWSIQLIGTESFDKDDEDWVCGEIFTTGEDLFEWKKEAGWETILADAKNLINQYLQQGEFADMLKQYQAIGIGFVDGDIDILYSEK